MRERLSINLSIARSCFVQCHGCYNHFSRQKNLIDPKIILDFLSTARRREIRKVTICGGDPLSRPDIIPLLHEIKNLGFSISLDTVGTPLLGDAQTIFFGNEKVAQVDARVLSSVVDMIGIPIDGASSQTFGKFRKGRSNILNEEIRILELLNGLHADLCVNTVAHRSNIDDFKSMLHMLTPYSSIKTWQIFEFMPIGPLGSRNREQYQISDADFTQIQEDVKSEIDRIGTRNEMEVEFKPATDRQGNYLLIDSSGLAWTPIVPYRGNPDNSARMGGRRIIIGDIRDPSQHERILAAILRPAEVLPELTKRNA